MKIVNKELPPVPMWMVQQKKDDDAGEIPEVKCPECRKVNGVCADCDNKMWEAMGGDSDAED